MVSAKFEADGDRAFADFTTLIDRAKAAGKLRADFVAEDMPMFFMANGGVLTATADAVPTPGAGSSATSPRPVPPEPHSRWPTPQHPGRCTKPCCAPPTANA